MLVLHYTGMASGAAALARLCDPSAEVSSHYLVWEDGAIDQLVSEDARAWHAGAGRWGADADINSVSVGIEIVNGGHPFGCPPYPKAQIAAVVQLSHDVCERRRIPAHRVLGHSDVAPARKEDPGEHFPWRNLALYGVGIWPSVNARSPLEAATTKRLTALLHAIGYACSSDGPNDQATMQAIAAFQRHWRPRLVNGATDAETLDIAEAVAAASGSLPIRRV